MASNDRGRARMTAALGNHRRIEIVRLLREKRVLCIEEVAAACVKSGVPNLPGLINRPDLIPSVARELGLMA